MEKKDKKQNFHRDVYNWDPVPTLGDKATWMETKFEVDENTGYLKGRAIIGVTGVQPYLIDGKTVLELRPPEEVFHPEALVSMRNLVIA